MRKYNECVLLMHLFFARLMSSEYPRSPEGPGHHHLEGQLSKTYIENQDIVILATVKVLRCFLCRNGSGGGSFVEIIF